MGSLGCTVGTTGARQSWTEQSPHTSNLPAKSARNAALATPAITPSCCLPCLSMTPCSDDSTHTHTHTKPDQLNVLRKQIWTPRSLTAQHVRILSAL
eukprot:4931139-Amphidinium_carterae.2